jgi:hypothetical protein
MKIKYVFNTKQLTEMAQEVEPIIALIKNNSVDFEGIEFDKLRWEDGCAVCDFVATLSPEQIMMALEYAGYKGDEIVGVNNDTNKAIFKDEINDMYIIGSVFLEFKNGRIEAEHGQARDEDCFAIFTGF